jgi:uncharacterized protein
MTSPFIDDVKAAWDGPIIDVDVHANVPSLSALFPYQDPGWVEAAHERGFKGPSGLKRIYPPNAPTTARPEWRPEGRPPASDLALVREHVLDPLNLERAVLSCYYAVDSLRHPDWAIALAQSVNDWIIAEWLDKDPRLTASITIPARDPAAAAAEIRRVGGHPQFVQVMTPVRADRLYGQRIWWPMFEAMVEHDLVMGVHRGGTTEDSPSPTGWASYYVEEYAAETQVYASQLTSLVMEGVFQRFPTLRVSMLEGGFLWLPMWGWAMNKKWKGLRREIPWLTRPPMDVVRDHMRFSVTPTDLGPDDQVKRILDWMGTEDLLMFATDYPHLHDDVGPLLRLLPESMKRKVMADTARDWYRLADIPAALAPTPA